MVLETIKGQEKGVETRLSTSLESFLERIVWKVVSAPQTIAKTTEAVIGSCGFTGTTATIIRSSQRNCTDESMIEKRCRQYVEAGTKLDPVAASNPSEIGGRSHTDILTRSEHARRRTRW